jgi:hypothetical protein
MVVDVWQVTWMNQQLTFGIYWLVVEVPRGPVMGCHVAPCGWFMVFGKIYTGSRESNPRPISWAVDWQGWANYPPHR